MTPEEGNSHHGENSTQKRKHATRIDGLCLIRFRSVGITEQTGEGEGNVDHCWMVSFFVVSDLLDTMMIDFPVLNEAVVNFSLGDMVNFWIQTWVSLFLNFPI